jgi:D-alanyl-D-alanine endopeptidase (penicillin-binding protein 7)
MKQKIKTALFIGVILGAGLSAPLQATTAKKTEQQSSKHAAAPVSKSKHVVNKSTGKIATKNTLEKPATAGYKAPVKSAKANSKSGKTVHAAVDTAKKPIRRVTYNDIDPNRLALFSASALVIDQNTGQSLLEKHSDVVVPIASISKLMTAMVVLDAHLDMHEVISIGEEEVDHLKGTRSRIPVGTTMTREAAMLLSLMSSENRAAHALGRHYPGGMRAFVAAMNRKALSLGMTRSNFEEPTGLSSNNVSTAKDLARMVAAAARYPEIRGYSTTAEAKLELNGQIREFHNTNALVRSDNWEIGVSKTGYISEAGRCLVMQARVADKPVVIVLLDSAGKMTRVGDANRIKRWMESASLASDRRPV